MPQAAFFSNMPDRLHAVYDQGRKATLEAALSFHPVIITSENFAVALPQLQDIEFVFATWGMLPLTPAQLEQLPKLKIVFYAAGTVQYFAQPFLERGITVVSAWAANAIPTAEYASAQIILATKGYFSAERESRTYSGRANFNKVALNANYPGNFETTVSLLGAGMVGGNVIRFLSPHRLKLLVFDPFLSEEQARELGVTKVSLEQAFAQGFVVSNHLANLPETVKMLGADLFENLQPYATFINTGRGATVDEAAMLAFLKKRPDVTAVLDVTFPEPPECDSPIYTLDNVFLTPHIAGSQGREVVRMADFIIEEFQRYRQGQPLRYSVSLEQLKMMA